MMSVEIWTEVLPYVYWWKPDDYMGGTPEYVVNTAENLAKLGYEVIVYYDSEPTELNGVNYLPRNMYSGDDVLLSCNGRAPFLAKRNISWTSKVDQTQDMYSDFDERIVLSKYHQGLFGEDSKIIPLAANPIKPKKKKFQAIYTSSPDRGLDFLLKMWSKTYQDTGLVLKTSYNASRSVSGVENLGKLTDSEMDDLYAESKYWLHPCQGIELFCISGYKAQMAGCVPIYIPNMALAETVKFGRKTDLVNFRVDVKEEIKNPTEIPDISYDNWMDVTITLDNIIKNDY